MYDTDKIFGVLKTSSPESTSGVQREIVTCVSMTSDLSTNVRESSFVKSFPSVSSTSAVSAGTAPSTSVGLSSRGFHRSYILFVRCRSFSYFSSYNFLTSELVSIPIS